MKSLLKNKEQFFVNNLHWPFFGAFMQQTPQAVLSINRLLNVNNFSQIVEIGTHDCGLSVYFALYCAMSRFKNITNDPTSYKNNTSAKTPKDFYTFDIKTRDENMSKFVESLGAKVVIQDAFSSAGIQQISRIIGNPGQTLLLCDGGNKKKELSTYANALKNGDIVMIHDFAKDSSTFKSLKERGVWSGWEATLESESEQDANIGPICKSNNIEQIHADEFDDVVWYVGQKKQQ